MTPKKAKDVLKMKVFNEIAIVYKEFVRYDNITNDKRIPQQKKILADPDKWRKKFKLFFDREKLINFDL